MHRLYPLGAMLVLALGACSQPATDCEEKPWYLDNDADDYGDTFRVLLACERPEGYAEFAGDCDDQDNAVHPDAVDTCDGRDDNCDGVADDAAVPQLFYVDGDDDGFGGSTSLFVCAAPPGFVAANGDCDDGDNTIHPDRAELCNGVDDNCDGTTDDDATDLRSWWTDADGDGFGEDDVILSCFAGPDEVDNGDDCDDTDNTRFPGALERCNGLDDDCDGLLTDAERDGDADGVRTCDGDCDDADNTRFPGAIETVADGADQDCDGLEICYLDADQDGFGAANTVLSADLGCNGPAQSSLTGDCDDLDSGVRPGITADVFFVDITAAAGLDTPQWVSSLNPPVCGTEAMSGGVAAGDFDQDGFVDLFVSSMYAPDLLYRNMGDGTFEDVSLAWGLVHSGSSNAAVFFDADANGTLDLFVSSLGIEGNRLYLNDGSQFFEVASQRGVARVLAGPGCANTFGVSAADVDGDGDLDLQLGQWHPAPNAVGDGARLFLNDGSGFFVDATLSSGLDLNNRAAFSLAYADFDGDNDLDLAVAADWGQSGLWVNDGSGVFLEDLMAGVGLDENGMGSDVADFDGDGDLDWFVTAIYDPRQPCSTDWGCSGNRLYVNDGTGLFTDGTAAAGLEDGGWGWGASFFDYDNDGDLDLAHGNGFPEPYFSEDALRLFENVDGVYHDVACETEIAATSQQRALISLDIDNDGDLDVFTTQSGLAPQLFRNEGANAQSWLQVTTSEPGNPFGVGSIVWVQAVQDGPIVRRDIHANGTFLGTGPKRAHVGLGDHESPLFAVQVQWPDGGTTTLNDVPVRQQLQVSR